MENDVSLFPYALGEILELLQQRSNVEATFSMIKRKFGERLRSKTETAQKNEILCKVLCHNLCVINHAMYELGVGTNYRKHSDSTGWFPTEM